MSENAPKLENAEIPQLPDLETLPESPPDPETPIDASQEDTKSTETEEACVVVMEDATPRGRRMADEAREVAAAHASLLVDIEACKRVSMSRRLLLSLISSAYVFVIVKFNLSVTLLSVGFYRTNEFHSTYSTCKVTFTHVRVTLVRYFLCGARVSFVSTRSVTRRCRPLRSAWIATVTSSMILRRISMT